jgi:hypothetical protein
MQIKEVKVWNEYRDDATLNKFRYNQLDLDGYHDDI